MSGHRALKENFQGNPMVDPGASGTITVDRSPAIVPLVSLTAETRTLARPTRLGAIVTLTMQTDGGDITLTVTGGFNEDAETSFTFSDAGQFATFVACYDGTDYFWRKVSDHSIGNIAAAVLGVLDGVTATAAELNRLAGVTPGTALVSKALVLDASGNVTMPAAPAAIDERNAEIVITTNVILGAENGRTYYLTLANGFTTTLPVPALGLRFRFIVATAPTTAYIIVTDSSANIMYGMMEERAGTAGVAGAARDRFDFVANQAKIGDWVEFYSDGTNWYYHGMVDVATGNTVAQT